MQGLNFAAWGSCRCGAGATKGLGLGVGAIGIYRTLELPPQLQPEYLFRSFFKRGNYSPEKSTDLPKVAQLATNGIWTKISDTEISTLA